MMPFAISDVTSLTTVPNNHTVQFESPSHTGILLSGLNTLRSKSLLVDVTLIAGGESFEVRDSYQRLKKE